MSSYGHGPEVAAMLAAWVIEARAEIVADLAERAA